MKALFSCSSPLVLFHETLTLQANLFSGHLCLFFFSSKDGQTECMFEASVVFLYFSRSGAFYRIPGFECHCDKRQREGERSCRQADNGWVLWMALQGGAAGGERRGERKREPREPMWELRLFPLEGIKAFHLLLKVIGLQHVRDPKGWKRKEQLWLSGGSPLWKVLSEQLMKDILDWR